jgi:hypothetical protein
MPNLTSNANWKCSNCGYLQKDHRTVSLDGAINSPLRLCPDSTFTPKFCGEEYKEEVGDAA